MAHPASSRLLAQQLYLAGASTAEIVRAVGTSVPTLRRWIRSGNWRALREQARQLRQEAGALVLEMTRAARLSRDPQQAYAALSAAELAGLHAPPPAPPAASAAAVAKALLAVLAAHPALGPLVRRHRAEVLEAVAREVERLGGAAPVSP